MLCASVLNGVGCSVKVSKRKQPHFPLIDFLVIDKCKINLLSVFSLLNYIAVNLVLQSNVGSSPAGSN